MTSVSANQTDNPEYPWILVSQWIPGISMDTGQPMDTRNIQGYWSANGYPEYPGILVSQWIPGISRDTGQPMDTRNIQGYTGQPVAVVIRLASVLTFSVRHTPVLVVSEHPDRLMVFSHQSKTTTRHMLNLCIPMMPFTPFRQRLV